MFDEEEDDGSSTPEVLKRFISQYEEHIKDASEYVELKNWGKEVTEETFEGMQKEHNMEWTIMSNIALKLKDFIKEAEGNLHRKYIQDFIKLLKNLLEGYIARVNVYRKLNKWSEIEDNDDYMDRQLRFQEDLLKNVHTVRKVMSTVNLDDAKGEVKNIPIHADKKVPFLMKDIIEKRFPKQFK